MKYFRQNRKGEPYKTCDNCRQFNRENFKMYRTNHLEKELERNKRYREHNRDKLREYDRERDKQRIEDRKQLRECECGASITKGHMTAHRRSKKHIEKMNVITSQATG